MTVQLIDLTGLCMGSLYYLAPRGGGAEGEGDHTLRVQSADYAEPVERVHPLQAQDQPLTQASASMMGLRAE